MGKIDIKNLKEMANFFSLFSDATRLKIVIFLLNSGEACCVNKISEALGLNQPAVSQQMRILRNAGIVTYRREGKFIRYTISDPFVKEIIQIGINRFKEVK